MFRLLMLVGALMMVSTTCLAQTLSVPDSARTRPEHHVVAITFDDLPLATGSSAALTPADAAVAEQVNRRILAGLARRHAQATGFVIQQRVEQIGLNAGQKVLKGWVRAGFDLGNHLYSHADVNALSIADAEQEIVRGESAIDQALAGVSRRPAFLRFPFNHTGDTQEKHDALAAFIASRGYRLAPCTMENADYNFNHAYHIAITRHDQQTAAKIRSAYLAFTAAEIDWFLRLDAQVFGRDAAHVMLLHASPLNADTIDQVLALFAQRGFRFVSLDEAMRDPAYAVPETLAIKYGWMWGYRWAKELHVKVDGSQEPEEPAWVGDYVKAARKA